ncbi:MAG TPA: hypothetical protein VE174_02520 [Actinomycetota bacterium]|nr:hypothetical protein [Actinomycetota bacterium]
MKFSGTARLVALAVLLVGLMGYLFLIDLGVNAGRVHRGVSVQGTDIGGLTFVEAEEVLTARGEELKVTPVVFGAEGFDCRFIPGRIGWGPQPHDTAESAMDVGRPILSTKSLAERIDAWLDGAEVMWADRADPEAVETLVESCDKNARALGLQLDRVRLRYEIDQAIVTWPRPMTFPVPFVN